MRPNWVEVDLDIIEANVRAIRNHLDSHGQRNTGIVAVVKADGYGHGAEMTARSALRAGADLLAVAFLEEGLALRESGLEAPILVLGWTPPDSVRKALDYGMTLTLASFEHGRAVARQARMLGASMPAHIKVDTGMSRLGFPADERGLGQAMDLVREDGLQIVGAFTHFAVADEDVVFTREQVRRFRRFVLELKKQGVDVLSHACNSAGILDHVEAACDLVRPGLILYGVYPDRYNSSSVRVRPPLTWKTRVAQVKEVLPGEGVSYGREFMAGERSIIATLLTGYADGYPRGLSNRGEVLVGGRRCRIAGRVCMDQTMIHLPAEVREVEPGTEVTLLGRQADEHIPVEELAGAMNTIPHEIFTGIAKRVPRVFVRDGRIVSTSDVLQF